MTRTRVRALVEVGLLLPLLACRPAVGDDDAAGDDDTTAGDDDTAAGCPPLPEPAEHRATAAQCLDAPICPSWLDKIDLDDPATECTSHADCDAAPDGCCAVHPIGGPGQCSYDDCETDADCDDGEACVCLHGFPAKHNRCVPADCRTDADCDDGAGGPGYCSVSTTPCGTATGAHCHGCDDECASDADCGEQYDPDQDWTLDGRCRFGGDAGRWICEWDPPDACYD